MDNASLCIITSQRFKMALKSGKYCQLPFFVSMTKKLIGAKQAKNKRGLGLNAKGQYWKIAL